MDIDILTKHDLQAFKEELLRELAEIIQGKPAASEKEYLRTKETRAMLGGISAGTLQTLRVKGLLKPTKLMGVFYYKKTEILALLDAEGRA